MINSKEGQRMVHEARTELVKQIYKDPMVLVKIEELMNDQSVTIFTDIDLDIDIAMTIYVFNKPT
ncbi:Na-translocating system protein MpsC family protein [Priestia megaterium]|uniref:Na-translocating system protein MpsC family protein n=1 Tax=Priestia megaterium TaxID=1404 RepID=UPI002731C699|nr:Na-translocating system protein MpsC family protein [Priestia megaterium]MDP1471827.1 Na-translocating system protein MpsC family protein [Priestia megaterium]